MLYHPVTIGSIEVPGNLFLAPVAGYSDRAFRSVCREGGANFAYTEMISTEALVRGSDKTALLMARAPNESQYAIQLFGGNAAVMAQAVRMILGGVREKPAADDASDGGKPCLFDIPEVIDINAGCPVPKITKTGAGSALTRDPERLYEITAAAVQTSAECAQSGCPPVPVTVKIRAGWDSDHITWKEAADAAFEAGAAAVTLHGRTRAQGYEGTADWSALAELVRYLSVKSADTVPVFGSGDVFSPEDAERMLKQTGCAGVMFARGAMGNPFIFIQTRQLLLSGSYEEIPSSVRVEAGLRELHCLIEDAGEESACRQMRKRFCAYSKGIEGGASLRVKIVAAETEKEYIALFREAGILK